jgi:hypothetical protein
MVKGSATVHCVTQSLVKKMLTLPDCGVRVVQATKRARNQFISPGLATALMPLKEPSDVPECHVRSCFRTSRPVLSVAYSMAFAFFASA